MMLVIHERNRAKILTHVCISLSRSAMLYFKLLPSFVEESTPEAHVNHVTRTKLKNGHQIYTS